MSKLRRYSSTRNVCFITCVTFHRRPLLVDHVDLFWTAVEKLKTRITFEIDAYVILPDHFHIILDPSGGDFTRIMQRLKMSFGMLYRKREGLSSGRVWQHRYWDHVIRDQVNMNCHVDYIHYNPVKHGFVQSPFDWDHTSIHDYRNRGVYLPDWGEVNEHQFDGEFGE